MKAPKIQIGSVVAAPGEQISVPVFLMEDGSINALGLCISFKPRLMEFDHIEEGKFLIPGTALWNVFPDKPNPTKMTLMFAWTNTTDVDFKAGLPLFHMFFKYIGLDEETGEKGYGKVKFVRDLEGELAYRNCEISSGIPCTAMETDEDTFNDGFISPKNANTTW